MTLDAFAKGQTAYLLTRRGYYRQEDQIMPVTVKTVGRKYVTVTDKQGFDRKFEENPDENYLNEIGDFGWDAELYPSERLAREATEYDALRRKVLYAVDGINPETVPLQALREIAAVIDRYVKEENE